VLYWFKGEGLQGFEEKERNQLRFWILWLKTFFFFFFLPYLGKGFEAIILPE
jgi:hypothetical protein